ncbi:unnamed protein product [Urochloa humidicola]
MSRAASGGAGRGAERRCRYRGVRRRAWGKWVSEIRVPGTRERLWLGSYAAPEAAAVAHDAAACLLRGLAGAAAAGHLNFPERAACYGHGGRAQRPLSPRSVQRVASDAGMAADAQLVDARAAVASSTSSRSPAPPLVQVAAGSASGGIGGAARGGGGAAYAQMPALPPHSNCSSSSSTYWTTPSAGGGSRSSSAGSDQQLVFGDISVDDIEILM